MMGIFPIQIVNTGEVKIVENLGKYSRTLQPGLNFIIPFLERVVKTVSTKQNIIDIEPSNMITSDNVSIQVDCVTYYQVTDPYKAVYGIENFKKAVAYTTITNLRSIVGEMSLDQVLSERATINAKLLGVVDDITNSYGLKIISAEVKEITPPGSILKAMEAELNAERNRRATVLKASGDKEAAVTAAEANKTSAILNAEAIKEEKLRRAEAEARAKELEAEAESNYVKKVAEAQAEALELINKALKESGNDAAAVIALKQTEMMLEMSKNPANKLIIPSETISSLGSLSAAAEILQNKK